MLGPLKRSLAIFGITAFLHVREPLLWRKAPQSKSGCMDRPNVQNLLVQMDCSPMDRLFYVNLDRPNGRRSNGPPMLRQFGSFKRMAFQWKAYVMSIWTVQMDDGPMNSPCYVNLDRPNAPSSIWTVNWTTYITLIWTVQNYANLDNIK